MNRIQSNYAVDTTREDQGRTDEIKTPFAVSVRELAKQLPVASAKERDRIRDEIIRALSRPPLKESPANIIEAVLEGLLESKSPGRLDEIIDILPHAGAELHSFITDAMRINPPDKTDPDYWYVLIRASGRTREREQTDSLIDWALKSNRRALMEAAILTLGERGDETSIARLRAIAQSAESPFIRELVEEVMEDCED